MSRLFKLLAGVLAMLSLALLIPAHPASARVTASSPHVNAEELGATAQSSSFDNDTDQVYEFTLINNSLRTVYVAYGKYRPYDGGELAPPSAWIASGWWRVAPGTSRSIYRSSSDDHIYFRIEDSNGAVVPRNYEDSADFCTSTHAFTSTELEQQSAGNGANFRIKANDGATYGATCAEAGGQWETFYKMRVHTDFTVH